MILIINMILPYTFANYENGLESEIFRINRESLIKDKVYNGIRISPEVGFEAVLSNKLARSYFGAADKWRFKPVMVLA